MNLIDKSIQVSCLSGCDVTLIQSLVPESPNLEADLPSTISDHKPLLTINY
ncbi:MAG: hypothetical protein O4861_10735 [Trichodesmium sp. St16_bin4-tuft]|uniref:hypothetical protein n=1 Tax=Trichodesmium erythraeum TaxID=1206 RepID=UPI0012DF8043|nr:hypothetical protein [Trichodesmium erythraeum GBRTRLIN201]MCH2051047.1 hypothetical protein [Trichodesmium sp. ALOHA_ZT_67]MCL2926655.1 hypothetical protein [Trichodesmium sp. MAG_R01]MDE5069626.1 hypothetical protein [Trichodesmium sp. St4_bin8_1]MDE5072795.1 hypothetical protein [Trichodesmium sp. St5_bin8]MDE5079342.1 hypothetical protein [Trichodesmium sp. St2_bin6]MDE5091947.1 hypothetical protein [Trichodesmium sp. St18_bin3_1_1]MDE5095827.1 hypothetical protein [Trichodesmium sp. 